jgi:hypothetical protein
MNERERERDGREKKNRDIVFRALCLFNDSLHNNKEKKERKIHRQMSESTRVCHFLIATSDILIFSLFFSITY